MPKQSAMTIEKRLDEIQQTQRGTLEGLSDLATIVKNITEHVYAEDEEGDDLSLAEEEVIEDDYGDEVTMDLSNHEEDDEGLEIDLEDPYEEDMYEEEVVKGGGHMMRGEVEEEEYDLDLEDPAEMIDDEMAMAEVEDEDGNLMEDTIAMRKRKALAVRKANARKARSVQKQYAARKGFSDTARKRESEEDAPFGEQQNDMRGLEGVEYGDGSGERANETFNAKFARMEAEMRSLRKTVHAVTKAKAITPPVGAVRKSNRIGGENAGVITREMQEQVKSRSWTELNQLRAQMGELPTHGS